MLGRRHDAVEAALAEHAAAPPDELAGGEVAVARRDVVEQHAGHAVAVVAHQHHPDGLVAALDQEREPSGRGAVPDEVGLELQDVGAVDAQDVAQVLVVRARPRAPRRPPRRAACATSLRMCHRLISESTMFIATIGQISSAALKPVSTTQATRLRTRKRSTRACISETISSAEPNQPIRSSQDMRGR